MTSRGNGSTLADQRGARSRLRVGNRGCRRRVIGSGSSCDLQGFVALIALASSTSCLDAALRDAEELTFDASTTEPTTDDTTTTGEPETESMSDTSDGDPTGDATTGSDTDTDDDTGIDTETTTTDPIPETCGDGIVQIPEACDDGNASNADDCLNSCALASCGDGFVHGDREECDDGNRSSDDACTNFCTLAECGDGIVQSSLGEECDEDDEDCNECVRDRLVFVTNDYYQADLGGLAGADLVCQQHADAANIGQDRTYKAWLSTPAGSPLTRFYRSPGRYVRTDGAVVATSWEDLVDGDIGAIINVTALKTTVPDPGVWSNTGLDGAVISLVDHCDAWTTKELMLDKKGRWGYANALDDWTDEPDPDLNPAFCVAGLRLYCFEQ